VPADRPPAGATPDARVADDRAPLDRARLARRLLEAGCSGPVRVVTRTDSTQARARTAALGGAPAGWTILAEEQTRGRGRSGRGWWAPPRSAILGSMVLRPELPPERLRGLSLVAGVAVAEAVRAAGVADVWLKWPNDCLAGGRKLAGVLAEVVPGGPSRMLPAVLVGVGCNVRIAPSEWPEELTDGATSCWAEGAPVERSELAAAILAGVWAGYQRWRREGLGWVIDAWLRLDRHRGTLVEARGPDGPIRGLVTGLSDEGSLCLLTDSGPRVVEAGEVLGLRAPGGSPEVARGRGPASRRPPGGGADRASS